MERPCAARVQLRTRATNLVRRGAIYNYGQSSAFNPAHPTGSDPLGSIPTEWEERMSHKGIDYFVHSKSILGICLSAEAK